MPWVTLLGSLLLTLLAATLVHQANLQRQEARFQAAAEAVVERIQSRMNAYVAVLRGAAGLFEIERVNRADFRHYVDRMRLREEYPGTLGLGYSPLLKATDVARVTAQAHLEGMAGFKVWPEGGAPRSAILYLEPLDQENQSALGFDMYTDPVREEAMERALLTGQPALTGRVHLKQEEDPRNMGGILLFVPVFGRAGVPPTVEQRRETLRGFAYAPFRVEELIAGIVGNPERLGLHLAVHEGSAASPQALLYASSNTPLDPERWSQTRQLNLAGRIWTLQFSSIPLTFLGRGQLAPVVAGLGVIFSLLLFLLTRSQTQARRRAADSEAARVQALEALGIQSRWTEAITTNATLGLVMMDGRQHCTFMNPAAEKILGITLADVLEKNVPLHDIVHHTRPDGRPFPMAECPIDRALPTRAQEQGEDVFVRPDGTFYPVAFTASPVLENGVPVGTVIEIRDITAERAAEAERSALLERASAGERQFRSMAEAMPQLVWTAGPDGSPDYYNQRWAEYCGRPSEQLLQGHWGDAIHPDDLPTAQALWRECQRAGRSYEVQIRIRGRDQQYRWFLSRAQPVHGADGRVVRWFGTSTDIHEQVQAQQTQQFLADASKELSSSLDYEQTLQRVAQAAVPRLADWCAVDVLDDQGQLRRLAVAHPDPEKVKLAHEMHVRYPPDLSQPHGLGKVLKTGESDWMPEISDALLVASARDEEQLQLARALALKSFVVAPLKVRDEVIGAITFVQAESGRRHTEADVWLAEELARRASFAIENARLYRKSEEDRRVAQALTEVGLALTSEVDRDKLVQRITDEATRLSEAAFGALFHNVINEQGEQFMLYTISGVPREAFSKFPMPRNTAIFSPTFEGSRTVRYDDVTKQPHYGKNAPRRGMPEGHLPVRSYLAVPVKSRSGEVLGGLFFGHPEPGRFRREHERLLEGVAAQAAAALDNARLFAALERSNAEVRSLNEDLERRVAKRTGELQEMNRELESFTYSVSHDLRAPLRHITGFAELLERRIGTSTDEKSREFIKTISRAGRQGGQLVDDLLSFSRMGRAELRQSEVDLEAVISEIRAELAPDVGSRDVQWKVDSLPVVKGDPAMLRVVLRNLLSNALKYTRPREQAVIEVAAREGDTETEVWVKDNGVGFDMQYVEKLFGVFQRLHVAEDFEGTGIGLATVRRIVSRHGGRTWAEGALGVGATFHLTLPKHPAAEERSS